MPRKFSIRVRRGTAAQWAAAGNTPWDDGELLYQTDTGDLKVGASGAGTAFSGLPSIRTDHRYQSYDKGTMLQGPMIGNAIVGIGESGKTIGLMVTSASPSGANTAPTTTKVATDPQGAYVWLDTTVSPPIVKIATVGTTGGKVFAFSATAGMSTNTYTRGGLGKMDGDVDPLSPVIDPDPIDPSLFTKDSILTSEWNDKRYIQLPAGASFNQVLTYDGSTWKAANATGGGGGGGNYTLPPATSSTLGGVKQGANLTIAGDGTISAVIPTVPVGILTQSQADQLYLNKANWTGTDLQTFTGLDTSFGTAGSVMTGAIAVGKTGQIKLVGVSNADTDKYSQVLVTIVGSSLSSYSSTTDYSCITATTGTVKLFTSVSGNTTANLTVSNTGNLTFTATSGGFGYSNATKALESLTDIVPGNLSYINQKYADARYVPKLANTTYGQANIPFTLTGSSTPVIRGWSLATACGTGTVTTYFGQLGRVSTAGAVTEPTIVELGTWNRDSTGNLSTGSSISSQPTMYRLRAFGNTTSNTTGPTVRSEITGSSTSGLDSGTLKLAASNASLGMSCQTLDPSSGFAFNHSPGVYAGCLTFSSTSTTCPYTLKMSDGQSQTKRSLTIGTIDGTRGGILWLKSVDYGSKDGEIVVYSPDEDLTGKAVLTETHTPWLQLNQSGAGATSGKLELYHNYNNGAGGANYSTGVAVYLDRVERYQSTGTANWTANSLITQGYADTRYAPIGGGGGLDINTANGLYQPKLSGVSTSSNILLNHSNYQAVTGEVGVYSGGAEVFHGFVTNNTQHAFVIGASYDITGYKGRSQGYRIGSEVAVNADPAAFLGQTEISSYLYDLSGVKTYAAKIKVSGDGLEISNQNEAGETPITMIQSSFGMSWIATGAAQAPGDDPMMFVPVTLTPGDDLTRPRWNFGSAVVGDIMPEIIPLTASAQIGAEGLSSYVHTYSGTGNITLSLGAGQTETTLHVINLGNATITLSPQGGSVNNHIVGSKTLAKSGVGTGWKITKVNTKLPGGNIWLVQDADADANGRYVPLSSPSPVTIETSELSLITVKGGGSTLMVNNLQMLFETQDGGGLNCSAYGGLSRMGGPPTGGYSTNTYMTMSDCQELFQPKSKANVRFSGSFTTADGKVVTIVDGIVEDIT